jgi:hypothetical protein
VTALRYARAPAPHRVVEYNLAVVAPVLRDKPHEAVKNELGALIFDAHGALEA